MKPSAHLRCEIMAMEKQGTQGIFSSLFASLMIEIMCADIRVDTISQESDGVASSSSSTATTHGIAGDRHEAKEKAARGSVGPTRHEQKAPSRGSHLSATVGSLKKKAFFPLEANVNTVGKGDSERDK
jgi:hypothetical protein